MTVKLLTFHNEIQNFLPGNKIFSTTESFLQESTFVIILTLSEDHKLKPRLCLGFYSAMFEVPSAKNC